MLKNKIDHLRKKFLYVRKNLFSNEVDFKKFWKKFEEKKKLPQELVEITDKFIASKSFPFISSWWRYCNIKDIKKLCQLGIENYGEIFFHYYTWHDWSEEEIKDTFEILDTELINEKINIFKLHNGLTRNESFKSNMLMLLLYKILKQTDEYNFLAKMEDTSFCSNGHPFIDIDDMKISHDKVNSLLQFSEINRSKILKENSHILEIGAGSGRMADTILSINNKNKYVICDVPIAIYISYYRLKKRFKEKKIELAIDIDNQNDLEDCIKKNDLVFIFPHQLKFIKNKIFDLTIAISCLHEMEKETLKFMMSNINNISHNFYFSIWKNTDLPFSLRGTNLKASNLEEDYFISSKWTQKLKKKSYFPSNIIQFLYSI
tara:strand:+ start:119 stop:1243 length:1125 start_codon:yes stop_codon:yes gene_type:complete